jgi:hypothetical protein
MIFQLGNRMLLAWLSAFALAMSPSVSDAYGSRNPSFTCTVTKGNGDTPPGEPPSADYYGNGVLWTVLYPEGVVFRPGGPGFVLPDGALQMKFPWWRKAQDKLTITGRRLDANAPPLRADIGESSNIHMVPTYIIFPTVGCWEVTGKVGDTSLVFVTRVVKIGRGP